MTQDKQPAVEGESAQRIAFMPFTQHCVVTLFATLLAFLSGTAAHHNHQLARAFERNSVVVTGRVVRFQEGQKGNVSPVLRYEFQGHGYEHFVPSKDGRYNMEALRAGHFDVRILREDPQVARVITWEPAPVFGPLIFLSSIAAFIAAGMSISLIVRIVRREF